jgi:hypothetical protein
MSDSYTIRWNGDKTRRIVTFRKSFEKELLKAHPQAIRVLLDVIQVSLRNLTEIKHTFDYDQMERLNKRLQVDVVKTDGGWVDKSKKNLSQHLIDMWIQDGVKLRASGTTNVSDILKALNIAYNKLLPLEEKP